MLDKKNRLTSPREFKSIYRNGVKIRGTFGMLMFTSDRSFDTSPLFGFVVGKKVGNAVTRHRLSRQLRHIVREYLSFHPTELSGMKFSYVAHSFPENFQSLRNELFSQMDQSIRYGKK